MFWQYVYLGAYNSVVECAFDKCKVDSSILSKPTVI